MRPSRLRAILGLLAAAMAWVVIASVPAEAAPRSISVAKPTWSSSKLSGKVTYVASVTTKHYVSLQLVRNSSGSSTAPSCLTSTSGCVGVTGVTVIGTPITNMATSTLAAGKTYSQSISATCRAATGTKTYWAWARVADSTGSVAYSVFPLSGAYC